jgi:hypothetical protein
MRALLTDHWIDCSGSPISVAPQAFNRHVTWLMSGGCRSRRPARSRHALPKPADERRGGVS